MENSFRSFVKRNATLGSIAAGLALFGLFIGGYAIAASKSPPAAGDTAVATPNAAVIQLSPEEEQRLVAALTQIQQRTVEKNLADANVNASQQFYRAEAADVMSAYGKSLKTSQIEPRQSVENGVQTAHLFIAPLSAQQAAPAVTPAPAPPPSQ